MKHKKLMIFLVKYCRKIKYYFGTASRLRSHAGLMTQMLAQILTDAMNCGAIPRQDPSQMIPLVHACVMGGRPTPSEPRARTQYLAALDAFVLRAVGAPDPHHEVPAIPDRKAHV